MQKFENGPKINSLETWPKSLTHVTPDGLDITGVIKIDFIEVFVCSGCFYFFIFAFSVSYLKPVFQGQKPQLQVYISESNAHDPEFQMYFKTLIHIKDSWS